MPIVFMCCMMVRALVSLRKCSTPGRFKPCLLTRFHLQITWPFRVNVADRPTKCYPCHWQIFRIKHIVYIAMSFQPNVTTLCSANGTAMVSVVCLSSETFVLPTQIVKLFGNIFPPYGSPIILGLPASNIFLQNSDGVTPYVGAKYRWGVKISRFSTNKSLYLANDAIYRHSYYGRRIGTRMRSIKWCHSQ